MKKTIPATKPHHPLAPEVATSATMKHIKLVAWQRKKQTNYHPTVKCIWNNKVYVPHFKTFKIGI